MESSNSSNNILVSSQRNGIEGGIRMQNPFTFKVLQVFTGFGIGCGVGIGVGRPMNIGAIPMVGQVMSATRGATDAFSGVSRHVNDGLRKVGAKNIEAGIGCGVGIGHGFGVGLAVKPGVLHQIQACLLETTGKLMTKFGISPSLFNSQGDTPLSLQSGLMTNNPTNQNPLGSIMQSATTKMDHMSQGPSRYDNFTSNTPIETAFGSRTEKVLNSFLQSPALNLKEDDTNVNELAGRLRNENNLLQMVLKHQQMIEELKEENEKLRSLLLEDPKIPRNKLEGSYTSKTRSPCIDCFDCRRKERRR